MKFHVFEENRFLAIENFFLGGYERVRAWTTKFGINRIAGANATLKISNLQEMAASRTRVTLFHDVHPFQSVCLVHAATTRTRGESRILHWKQITKAQVVWCSTVLRPSRLFASSSPTTTDVQFFLFYRWLFIAAKKVCLHIHSIISKSLKHIRRPSI